MVQAKAEYFGIKFYELAKFPFPVRFTIGYDDEKGEHHLMGDGVLTVDKTEGSYAYGPELQIHLRFTGKLKEKLERAFNNGHDRIEICMAESDGINFFYNALVGYQKLPKPNTMSKPGKPLMKVADFV